MCGHLAFGETIPQESRPPRRDGKDGDAVVFGGMIPAGETDRVAPAAVIRKFFAAGRIGNDHPCAAVQRNKFIMVLRKAVQQDQTFAYGFGIRSRIPVIDDLAVDATFRGRRSPDSRVERILVAVRDQPFLLGQAVIIQPDE